RMAAITEKKPMPILAAVKTDGIRYTPFRSPRRSGFFVSICKLLPDPADDRRPTFDPCAFCNHHFHARRQQHVCSRTKLYETESFTQSHVVAGSLPANNSTRQNTGYLLTDDSDFLPFDRERVLFVNQAGVFVSRHQKFSARVGNI